MYVMQRDLCEWLSVCVCVCVCEREIWWRRHMSLELF